MHVRHCEEGINQNSRFVLLALSLLVSLGNTGCRKVKIVQETPRARVAYTAITNPVEELCTDDSGSRTGYFSVHLVRIAGSRIWLDGTAITSEALRQWTVQTYGQLPEKVLRVQFADADEQAATQALLPIIEQLPDLRVRRAPFSFTCPKL
jgi:hypothetical protein